MTSILRPLQKQTLHNSQRRLVLRATVPLVDVGIDMVMPDKDNSDDS
jgi:hypothetical protein